MSESVMGVRPAEAARILGVGRTKVYELMQDGRLTSVSLGRRTRVISVESIRALLAARSDAKAAA